MGDEVREYVRAAQQAELRGDLSGAVELLIKAASVYRSTGRPGRALSMFKHARRLAPARSDLDAEILRLESFPGPATDQASSPDEVVSSLAFSLDEQMREIVGELAAEASGALLEQATPELPIPGDSSRTLPERGPQLADPDVEAWCSFCCLPDREVGALVAGPAGAFVCANCTAQVVELIGPGSESPAGEGDRAGAGGRGCANRSGDLIGSGPRSGRRAPGYAAFAAQDARLRALGRMLAEGHSRVLLIGPEGTGKSVLLRRLRLELQSELSGEAPVLVDLAERIDESVWQRLGALFERHRGPVVIALRGNAPAASTFVVTEHERIALPTTSALVEAMGGAVPREVVECIDGVAGLGPVEAGWLEQLASALLLRQGQDEQFVRAIAPVLAREALASGRGAHELVALVRRVPRGGRRIEQGSEDR